MLGLRVPVPGGKSALWSPEADMMSVWLDGVVYARGGYFLQESSDFDLGNKRAK